MRGVLCHRIEHIQLVRLWIFWGDKSGEFLSRSRAGRRFAHRCLMAATTHVIIGASYALHNELGFGFLEAVYSNGLAVLLRDAVDQLVVDYFSSTLADVTTEGSPADVVAARDKAVSQMLRDNPPVVNYVRRAILDPSQHRTHLLDVLVDLTRHEVGGLRKAGRASTKRSESTQVVAVLVRQMGELLLAPMVDAIWDRVAKPGEATKPRLHVLVE